MREICPSGCGGRVGRKPQPYPYGRGVGRSTACWGPPPNLRVHGADVAANPSFPSADVTREPARTPTVFTSPACHASRCHG
jgi:hypothetical protein